MAVLPTPGYPPKAPGAQEPCSAAHIGIRRTGFIPRKDLRLPIAIKMPALSPTMEEGTLAKWLVKVGDKVRSGDIMAEIETDKATMEFESIDEGVVADIAVAEGTEGVKVGTVIATLAEEGEDVAAAKAAKAEAPEKPSPLQGRGLGEGNVSDSPRPPTPSPGSEAGPKGQREGEKAPAP